MQWVLQGRQRRNLTPVEERCVPADRQVRKRFTARRHQWSEGLCYRGATGDRESGGRRSCRRCRQTLLPEMPNQNAPDGACFGAFSRTAHCTKGKRNRTQRCEDKSESPGPATVITAWAAERGTGLLPFGHNWTAGGAWLWPRRLSASRLASSHR